MIDVLIAAYKGQEYLGNQLDSILNCKGFDELVERVIVSDDSPEQDAIVIKKIVESKGDKFIYVKNSNEPGVVSNFGNAATLSKAEYIMFSDQDDIWLEDKILVLFEGLKKAENDGKPAIFFSDLIVVDDGLNIIDSSFWASQGIDPTISKCPGKVALQNVSPGCVMIINRDLLRAALPFPKNVMMHDWWLLIIASCLGNVAYTEKPMHLYRQHDNNVIGAQKISLTWKLKKMLAILFSKDSTFMKTLIQAEEVNSRLSTLGVFNSDIAILAKLRTMTKVEKLRAVFNSTIRGSNMKRNILLFLKIIFVK